MDNYDEKNIFNKILNKEIKCEEIENDEYTLSFEDINKQAPVHALVIPKNKYKDIILKPLYGNGGHGVFFIKRDDKNFHSLIEMFMERNNEQFIIQEYIPEITEGDKRIILINGQPLGAINRIPGDADVRANLHVGGEAHKTNLSKKEIYICETIGPYLKKKGLLFVGIDIIGDKLTEINVTSPTGLKEIYKIDNVNLAKNILGLF